jgi:hypothetical protein
MSSPTEDDLHYYLTRAGIKLVEAKEKDHPTLSREAAIAAALLDMDRAVRAWEQWWDIEWRVRTGEVYAVATS